MELSGLKVAAALKKQMRCSTHPHLATVRVGENPIDVSYEVGLGKKLLELGMDVEHFHLPETVSQEDLDKQIEELNQNKHVHGIILFQPLPHGLHPHAIAPNKDVDCSTLINQGKLLAGLPCYLPNAAGAVMALLEHYHIPLQGTNVTLIGRSSVVGRPLSILLIQAGATVTVCNSKTRNLAQIARCSGILISAVGQANFITREFVHENQVVVDIGTNYIDGKVCGDISPEIHHIVAGYTPTPGGIGPVTTAVLAKQVAQSTIGLPPPVFLGR